MHRKISREAGQVAQLAKAVIDLANRDPRAPLGQP